MKSPEYQLEEQLKGHFNLYLNSEIKFLYFSMKIFWQELLQTNLYSSARLSDYFFCEEKIYRDEKTKNIREMFFSILPTKKFFKEGNMEKTNAAFETLCELIAEYEKGYREIHVHLLRHENIP